MGLLDLLMPYSQTTGYGPQKTTNPFTGWLDQNRGKITGAFGGMVGAGNDPRMALQGFTGGLSHGVSVDDENALIRQQQADAKAKVDKETQQQNATILALQKANRPDLVEAVNGGGMSLSDAWTTMLKKPDAKDPIKLGAGDTLLDPNTYTPLATAPKLPDLPSGMTLGPDGVTQIAPPGSKEAFDREQALNQQYASTDPVKTYQMVRNGHEKIRAASQAANGPGDVSMIFAYMKMLDPTSVVREGEFATAQNAGGVGQTVANLYNSVLNGQKLTPELRQQFLAEADKMYKEAAGNLSSENDLYSTRATSWGVDPSHFLVKPETYQPVPPGGNVTSTGIPWSVTP